MQLPFPFRRAALALFALGLGALAPATASGQSCPLVSKYDGSNWWWGAFGNCKRQGGPTDRAAIFECAWSQVPPNEKAPCLKASLLMTDQTRRGIDAVVAANTPPNACSQLIPKYDGSNWWWGAFGNCKKQGGPTDRAAIFECAWSQVPPNEKVACLRAHLVQTDQTRRGIDEVFANNRTDTIAKNHSIVSFTSCADRRSGCPEACDLPPNRSLATPGAPEAGSVPFDIGSNIPVYFEPRIPPTLLDTQPLPNQTLNVPPARNIGANEGRLSNELRAAARVASPLKCSLHASAILFAQASRVGKQRQNLLARAQAFADLSVTGHKAFRIFSGATPGEGGLPGESYCRDLHLQHSDAIAGCPNVGTVDDSLLVAGCHKALDRAYRVANFLRAGQAIRVTGPFVGSNRNYNAAAAAERIRKLNERNALDYIAVSGEDDSPHRPVNAPSSDFPQYELDVPVAAPDARPPTTVNVHARYIIAQSRATAPTDVPAVGWRLAAERGPSIDGNAEVLIFVHGMDSRAEEADDITKALFAQVSNGTKNLVVISVDLPTSGYSENLDFNRVSLLSDVGAPKITVLPVPYPIPPEIYGLLQLIPGAQAIPPVIPPGVPIPDFQASGRTPLLDFIEAFIVQFVETLDKRVAFKGNIKAVMGGSLGGNMSFRLGRRPGLSWLPKVVVWSPASIWSSLGEGNDIAKHFGVRSAWEGANAQPQPDDRQKFFGSWDKAILPVIIPMAQADTWTSDFWPCKKSAIAAARLDRHETYDAQFLRWHWRLATEQLLFSHQTNDAATHRPRFLLNEKPMLLGCGVYDTIKFNDICGATQRTAPNMVTTPGKAIFLDQTGHSLDNERRVFWAQETRSFLSL